MPRRWGEIGIEFGCGDGTKLIITTSTTGTAETQIKIRWTVELWDRPELARKVRTIAAIGPSTIQPVVVSPSRLSPAEQRTIVAELVGLGEDPRVRPLMDAAFVERFVAMDGTGYDDIPAHVARGAARRIHWSSAAF